MTREIRTRTTIETESISIIACRQVFHGGCEVEATAAAVVDSLVEAQPPSLQSVGLWLRARHGLVTSLKTLLRFLEATGSPPHS